MEIQRQLSNGSWINVETDQVDGYLDAVLGRESWFAPRVNREPMSTREQVLDFLASGKSIYFGDDWYSEIRVKPAPRQPKQVIEVQCDCGHTVAKNLVMNASLGTSCPDCYDRMSD